MYTIQALWTAARHRVGAKFVICNNGAYQLLKLNIQQYWKDLGLPEGEFPASFDLRDPDIRFDLLAEAMGVGPARVDDVGADRPGARRGPRRRPPVPHRSRGQQRRAARRGAHEARDGRPVVIATTSAGWTGRPAIEPPRARRRPSWRPNALTEAEVKALVDAWYHALDIHVPVEEIVPMVAAEGLECTGRKDRPSASTVQGLVREGDPPLLRRSPHHEGAGDHAAWRRGGRQARGQLAGQGLEPAGCEEQVARDGRPSDLGRRSVRGWGRAVIKKYVVDGMDLMPGSRRSDPPSEPRGVQGALAIGRTNRQPRSARLAVNQSADQMNGGTDGNGRAHPSRAWRSSTRCTSVSPRATWRR